MLLTLSSGEEKSLEDVTRSERNLLHCLRRSTKSAAFQDYLWSCRGIIQAITARHLGLRSDRQCTVQSPDTWIRGQFNVCVIVEAQENDGSMSKKVFRCPMPHKVGEERHSGAIEEKVRSEVANYAWIEQRCPEIPVPHLIGFGLPNKNQFTHERYLPWYTRWRFKIFSLLFSVLTPQQSCPYVRNSLGINFDTAYLLMDFIEETTGIVLSETWAEHKQDPRRMDNLFRGLSQVMLSLARIPQPQIGSLRFDDNGTISLANRPLLCAHVILENEGSSRILKGPYRRSEKFVLDLLRFHEQSFDGQPNAAKDEEDCRLQMSHMVLLRAVIPELVDFHYEGPFVLQLTDLHASNIFVDEEWNITGVIDLEFVCALPPDMLGLPYWLSVESIDEAVDHMDHFVDTYNSFTRAFEEEEQAISPCVSLVGAIRKAWDSGAYWCYRCLTSVNAMPSLVEDHIQPLYGLTLTLKEEKFWARSLSRFWTKESCQFVARKVAERRQYVEDVEAHFELA